MRKPMNSKGFSLLEFLVAVGIFALIGSSFVAVYWTGERLVRQGLSLANIQSITRIGTEKIERELRMGVSAIISGTGDRIQFVVDTDGNPYTLTDRVTREFFYSAGTMTYDPNTAVVGNVQVIMTNVQRVSALPIFGPIPLVGKVIQINLRVTDMIEAYRSLYSGSDVTITSSVYMRN